MVRDVAHRADNRSDVRLIEIVAALSMASDLGIGQSTGHLMRSCLLAGALGERTGLADDDRAMLHLVALLGWVGCVASSRDVAATFGDDIAYRSTYYDLDLRPLPFLGYLLGHGGRHRPLPGRVATVGAAMAQGPGALHRSLHEHCLVTAAIARRLGIDRNVCDLITFTFARWDAKGVPRGCGGSDLPAVVGLWHLADIAEVHHRRGGVDHAIDAVRSRRGGQLVPVYVDAFCTHATELFAELPDDPFDAVIAGGSEVRLTDTELDGALATIADYVDLKSPWFSGHSRAVADLARRAAVQMGLPGSDVVLTQRAGLVHDLGRVGVSNSIWDKPGPLSADESEQARMHAYLGERMFAPFPGLRPLGAVAAMAHERLDGTGYHRGLAGHGVPIPARILAAADCYEAISSEQPYRPAHTAGETATVLRREADADRLDRDVVEAVLVAAGHAARRTVGGTAGLTPRELEVLDLMARGRSNRQIAQALGIRPKTVGNHIEHIYTKADVNSRATATLFAMEHGLVRPGRPGRPDPVGPTP